MVDFKLCPPSLIYLIFSATQIVIDTFKGLYNTAFFKLIIAFMVTILLNALCQQGLGIISWIIVFVPFILMTVIVTMLLYVFGLDVARGPYQPVPPPPKNHGLPPPPPPPPQKKQHGPPPPPPPPLYTVSREYVS